MANLFDPSELYKFLAAYGATPQWAKRSPGSGANAEYDPSTNRMVAPAPFNDGQPDRRVGSLAHEMSHAAQYQLFFNAASKIQEKKLANKKITEEEKQFLDTAQKMFAQQFGMVAAVDKKKQKQNREDLESVISKMYTPPKGKKDQFDYYRTSPTEMQAFGVGRMSKGADVSSRTAEANPHLDPTQTTEFSILMNQFAKLPKDVQTISTEFNKEQRKVDKMNQYYQFEDILSDPFKSTIK